MPVDHQLPLLRDPLQRFAFQDAGVALEIIEQLRLNTKNPRARPPFDLRLLRLKLTTRSEPSTPRERR